MVLALVFIVHLGFAQEAPPQQSGNPKSKSAKKIADKKKEREEEAERSEEKAKKRHMKIQTKETRKRMKKTAKEADRWNKRKGDPWIKKVFKPKRKKK